MNGPLDGVKVLDLSRVLAGPYCTMILGDLGADVIKVESPGGNDDTRYWGPPFKNKESAYYLCTNRNKRAITVNLKTEKGRKIITDLVRQADVLIHNFKTGTMEKWQLGYEHLKTVNPRLVFCGISGFGATGPYKHLPGYDFIIQAMSGLMSITGTEESGPLKVGVAISDVLTGLYAAIGILGALHERNQSGLGQCIDLSLFDSQLSALVNVASNYLISGMVPKRLGNQHPNVVPYQPFETKDGEMVVAVGNDGQFQKLCTALGLPELSTDERFVTNELRLRHRESLEKILTNTFRQKTSAEWQDILNRAGVPCGPINDLKAVFDEKQIEARNMLVHVEHPTAGTVPLVGSPLHYSRTPVSIRRHPPVVGEHTKEVLQELGLQEEEIEEMEKENVI